MSSSVVPVEVKILGKDFLVSCPVDEKEGLIDAATHLNGKMLEIKNSGKVVGTDRIAIMAALNITYEFLKGKPINPAENEELAARVKKLAEQVDKLISND